MISTIDFSGAQAPFSPSRALLEDPPKATLDDVQKAFSRTMTRRLGYVVLQKHVFHGESKPRFYESLASQWRVRFPSASLWSVRGCAPWVHPHVTDWIPFQDDSVSTKAKRPDVTALAALHANDLILLSNPLYLWGSVAKEDDVEALGHLLYERGAFLVLDESGWDTCRLSASPTPFGSLASACPHRTLVLESLQTKAYVDTGVFAAVKGTHPLWSTFDLESPRVHLPDTLVACMARVYSLTFASIDCDRMYRMSTILHALRLYAYTRLKPLTKTIGLGEGGTAIMVPFPNFKLEAAAKLDVVLVKPSDYAIRGYVPLFLTDFDGQAALQNAPTPFIYRPAALEDWVRVWAPHIKEGLDRLEMVLTTFTPQEEGTAEAIVGNAAATVGTAAAIAATSPRESVTSQSSQSQDSSGSTA